ncbi:MAG TPA: NAD-dependent DNA ligase LigA [Nitrospira sp.]|nr:NAD-dependent DNA ligase LigA [Nitrospira sp.]
MNFKNNPSTTFRDIHALTSAQASLEIQALREGIEYHNSLYYVKNRPKIADGVYDKLFRRLQDLEAAFPEFQSNTSPTQQVGAEPVEELKKIEHSAPMLSLNATLEKTEVEDFLRLVTRKAGARTITYVLEPKFDGLSLEVVYEHGVFRRAATRGDGHTGEAVSANMRMIKGLPLRCEGSPPRFLAVRGELFMNKDDFRRINKKLIEQGEDPFTNPRNAAASIVRRLNPKVVERRPLSIVFYDILKVEGARCSSHWDELKRLAEWGLMTDSHNARCTSFEEILTYHQKMEAERNDLDYEIDGVVIKLDDLARRQALGVRQRSPRWAFAWKFTPRQEVTTLEDIVVQVGMSGILTPVALLRPVDVGGVTISRATLHNEQDVQKKDLRPGDKVRVARAGDVIPEVVSRVGSLTTGRGKRFVMPDICPACGSRVRKEGAATICPAGLSCSAQLVGHLIHFASREAMNITGLGETTAWQLVDSRLAKNIADLYDLSTKQFLQLDGIRSAIGGGAVSGYPRRERRSAGSVSLRPRHSACGVACGPYAGAGLSNSRCDSNSRQR